MLIGRLIAIRAGGGRGGGTVGISLLRNRAIPIAIATPIAARLDAERGGHLLLGWGRRKARKRGRRETGGIKHVIQGASIIRRGGGRGGGVVVVVDGWRDLVVSGLVIRIRFSRPLYAEWTFLRLGSLISIGILSKVRRNSPSEAAHPNFPLSHPRNTHPHSPQPAHQQQCHSKQPH